MGEKTALVGALGEGGLGQVQGGAGLVACTALWRTCRWHGSPGTRSRLSLRVQRDLREGWGVPEQDPNLGRRGSRNMSGCCGPTSFWDAHRRDSRHITCWENNL